MKRKSCLPGLLQLKGEPIWPCPLPNSCGCSGHERHDDHHCPTKNHEEIHHRWVVALAWLGFDRGNGSLGSWDGGGLACVTTLRHAR